MDKEQMSLRRLASYYEVYNKTVGKPAHTIRWYNNRLKVFLRFVGPEPVLADLTVESVRAYIRDTSSRRCVRQVRVANSAGPLAC